MKILTTIFLFCIYGNTFSQTAVVYWSTINSTVPDKMYGLNIWDGTAAGINNDVVCYGTATLTTKTNE